MQENIPTSNGVKGLTGNVLKWLAMAFMVVDHIGAFVLEPYLAAHPASVAWLQTFDLMLRVIGRLAFPLFCFLLVEGFFHTHSRKKYLLQLAGFALLSDPIFDYAMSSVWFDLKTQNVFFTLALGLLAVWCMETLTAKGLAVLGWGCGALCCAVAQLCYTDYGLLGVALILAFYLFRGKKSLYVAIPLVLFFGDMAMIFFLYFSYFATGDSSAWIWLLECGLEEICGAFSLLFVARYNGRRGGKMPKYFFYVFYPAHLLLLAGVRNLVVGL